MEMRRQGGSEGQGTARSASKSRKQTGETTPGEQTPSSTKQDTATNQGASSNQQTSLNQGQTGQQSGGEQNLLQHAKQATGEVVNKVQQQAGSQLNRQKESAASELSQVANAVRRIRENLPQEEMGPIARVVGDYGEKAANNLERLSTYIREQDPKRLLDDVQNFGRRQPALMLGAAFLLGFAGARLIRSSMDTGTQQLSRRTDIQTTFTPQNVSATRQPTNPGVV